MFLLPVGWGLKFGLSTYIRALSEIWRLLLCECCQTPAVTSSWWSGPLMLNRRVESNTDSVLFRIICRTVSNHFQLMEETTRQTLVLSELEDIQVGLDPGPRSGAEGLNNPEQAR